MAIIGLHNLRDPWLELQRLRSEMDRAMGRTPRTGRAGGILPLRVTEDAESVVVEAPLPGVDPETVELTVTGDNLTIKGERAPTEQDGREHRRERWTGRFVRMLAVPGGLDIEGVVADYCDGLLRIRLPRPSESLPRKIEVRAAAPGKES